MYSGLLSVLQRAGQCISPSVPVILKHRCCGAIRRDCSGECMEESPTQVQCVICTSSFAGNGKSDQRV